MFQKTGSFKLRGALNTVLVPQIVRAVKKDADRGEAYTNRIMTLGLMVATSIAYTDHLWQRLRGATP